MENWLALASAAFSDQPCDQCQLPSLPPVAVWRKRRAIVLLGGAEGGGEGGGDWCGAGGGGEEGGGTEQKKTMKMDKKNVHSRAYHKTLAKLRKQGIDDDEAKQQARLEAKLAVVELAKAEAGFDV